MTAAHHLPVQVPPPQLKCLHYGAVLNLKRMSVCMSRGPIPQFQVHEGVQIYQSLYFQYTGLHCISKGPRNSLLRQLLHHVMHLHGVCQKWLTIHFFLSKKAQNSLRSKYLIMERLWTSNLSISNGKMKYSNTTNE